MNDTIWQSFLYAWTFWAGMALGCFALLLMHNTMKAKWGLTVVRMWEAGAKTVPIMMVILIIAYFAGLKNLYPWNNPTLQHSDAIIAHRLPYLNSNFFVIRMIVLGVIWWIWIAILTSSSARQDKTGDRSEVDRRSNWAAPGIVMFFLTMTFAYTDWIMSLDPHWYSTIFPAWIIVGYGLQASAFTALTVARAYPKPPYTREVITRKVTNDLGNQMLMYTMFWAYFGISQFMLQWSGNLPQEVTFWYGRVTNGWLPLGTMVTFLQFFVPFVLLLSGRTKNTPKYLASTAILILAMRACDYYWVIMPTFKNRVHPGVGPLPMDILCFVVLGVIWYGAYRFFLGQQALMPRWLAEPEVAQEALKHA